MAKPDLSTERPGDAPAQPGQRAQTRHAASAGGQAAKLKDMQATLQNTLRHHPVVLEQQEQRAQDVQLRTAMYPARMGVGFQASITATVVPVPSMPLFHRSPGW
jgi:hypothetical protein